MESAQDVLPQPWAVPFPEGSQGLVLCRVNQLMSKPCQKASWFQEAISCTTQGTTAVSYLAWLQGWAQAGDVAWRRDSEAISRSAAMLPRGAGRYQTPHTMESAGVSFVLRTKESYPIKKQQQSCVILPYIAHIALLCYTKYINIRRKVGGTERLPECHIMGHACMRSTAKRFSAILN